MLAFNFICQLRCVICSIKTALREYIVRRKMERSSNLTSADILRKEAAQGQSHKCILAFFKCHYSITLQSSILQVQLSVTASCQSFWSVGHGSPTKCLGLPWALSLPLSLSSSIPSESSSLSGLKTVWNWCLDAFKGLLIYLIFC